MSDEASSVRDVAASPESTPPSGGSLPRAGVPADAAPADDDLPLTLIRPRSAWRLLDRGELWRYRDLLWILALRDIQVRYKQTVLGVCWAVLQPVLTALVFTIFFGHLAGISQRVEIAYPVFVYAALLPWTFFAEAVAQSSQSMIASASLITKVYFPRWLIPCASAVSLLMDFLISWGVMFCLMAIYRVPLTANLLLLPPVILLTLLATLGAGSLLAALSVAYRDFRYVVPFLLQTWMFLSPVAYPLEIVPPEWRAVYALNPMAGIIEGYRSAVLGQAPSWACMGISGAAAIGMFLLGVAYFHRVERRFADII
jgi:lipopolysaccharide transport system permease protein